MNLSRFSYTCVFFVVDNEKKRTKSKDDENGVEKQENKGDTGKAPANGKLAF